MLRSSMNPLFNRSIYTVLIVGMNHIVMQKAEKRKCFSHMKTILIVMIWINSLKIERVAKVLNFAEHH